MKPGWYAVAMYFNKCTIVVGDIANGRGWACGE